MRRIILPLLAAAAILLLVFSEQALSSAAEALSLWWNSVLPALFPFYALTSLLFRFGAFDALRRRFRAPVIPCLLLGGISGNPTGARVAAMMGVETYAAACNLMSPMFLLGVVSVGLCGDAGLFRPLAVAHYGSALLTLVMQLFVLPHPPEARKATLPRPLQGGSAMQDIGDAMVAMLTVGGCIVFFYTVINTATSMLFGSLRPLLSAMLLGITEVTAGCSRIAALTLPVRVRLGLLAFVTSFGGLSIFAQSVLVANLRRPAYYLLCKFMQGCFAALIGYVVAPLFPALSVSVWSNAAEAYAQNALIGLTFLLAAGTGLLFSYLLALCTQKVRVLRVD